MTTGPNNLNYDNYHDHLPEPPAKAKINWLAILTIIVIVAAVAAIAYIFFIKNKPSDTETNIEVQLPGTQPGKTP